MTEHLSKWREFYLKQNQVFLGEVNHEHVDQIITDLIQLSLDGKELVLKISSPGGNTSAGFKLAQFSP